MSEVSPVDFGKLPFKERPDLSPYLIHLTRGTEEVDNYTGLDNLRSMLEHGVIWGSNKTVKGPRSAACFMDVPFNAVKHICTEENEGRYGPYGIVVPKRLAYKFGARPVLYLSNQELDDLKVPTKEKWRVVRLEVSKAGWISWLHEREWRCPDGFPLPITVPAVLVHTTTEAMLLQAQISDAPKDQYRCVPKSVLPLEVVCQGLSLPLP